MTNIKTALPLVDEAWIPDNSSEQDRFKQIAAIIKSGCCEKKVDLFPRLKMRNFGHVHLIAKDLDGRIICPVA